MELEDNIRKLRESLTVTSAQVLRHEDAIKDREEWLRSHVLAMSRHEEWLTASEAANAAAATRHDREMAELRENGRRLDERITAMAAEANERGKALDKRIADLVSGIGEFMRKRQ